MKKMFLTGISLILFILFTLFGGVSQNNKSNAKLDISSSSINYFDSSKVNKDEFKIIEDSTSFSIVEHSPINELPAHMKRPTIYVLFSQPVVPISRLGSPLASSGIMKIAPEINGVYRWYGTKLFAFEPNEDYIAQREYVVTVADTVKSLGGKSLTGYKSFKFSTERLSINSVYPSGEDVPLESAKKILAGFNYPVNPEVIKKYIRITSKNKNYNFTVARPSEEYGIDKKHINKFVLVNVSENFSENTTVNFTLLKGARSEEDFIGATSDINHAFSTLKPFVYNRFDTYNYSFPQSEKSETNPVFIEFSHPLSEKSVRNNIFVSIPVKDLSGNIEAHENMIKISNLPVTYNSIYSVTLKKGIEDIYGRKLAQDEQINIEVPNAARNYYFPNTGVKMLEAQFAPKIVFEYQNVFDGLWNIGKIDDPYKSYGANELKPYDFSKLKENVRHFEVLDLSPYLNSGKKGFAGISWNFASLTVPEKIEYNFFNELLIKVKDANQKKIIESSFYTNNNKTGYYLTNDVKWDYSKLTNLVKILKTNNFPLERPKYEQYNLQLQVTDLGITARYAYNKVLVWVNSLSSGEPVKNAKVTLKDEKSNSSKKEAYTNGEGLAVFNLKENEYVFSFYDQNRGSYLPRIFVEKDNDKADFIPNYSHNTYHFGIYETESPFRIEEEKPEVFLFTDRGLYKPGESVTYRGIDRILKLGEYRIYQGGFKIAVKDIYNESKVIYSTDGRTTESGGFYGSFKLPDNIDPGNYMIVYSRGKYSKSIDFQVANFRRLSFQVKVTKPNIEKYIQGDVLSFKVAASYLSGGALSKAKCGYYWTKEAINFAPRGENWRSFRFGTTLYEGSVPLNEGDGFLNQDGELSCRLETGSENQKGATYSYNLFAQVEDIDRQVIQGAAGAIVHPAGFYIGARFSADKEGWWSPFVKKGEQVETEIALVEPDGKLVKMNGAKNIKTRLIRIEWKVAQQKGVYNRVNTRYEQVEELEKEESVNITSATGKFFIKPEKSGQYKLEVEAFDEKGRTAFTNFHFYSTGSDWFYWNSEGANDITMIADKNIYEAGDTARILVQSSLPEGSYLLTVEREGILEEKIIKLKGSANLIEVPIKEKHLPIIYIALSSFSKRSEAPSKSYEKPDLGKPKGFFGIIPLRVSTAEKEISLEVVNSKKSYRPGSDAEVLIKAKKNGKPVADAEITFLAADRGVLDLINYHVPDPLSFFYDAEKFPLAVGGADSRSILMDPVTYELKDLQGGSGGEEASKLQKRKDFRPTAVFEPFLKTDKNGEVRVKFKLPDNLTTYRTTAIAVKDEKFGIKEDELLVQNPINVRTALPRKLRLRDTSFAGVVLTNISDKEEELTVSVVSDILVIEGERTKRVKIKPNSSEEVTFKIAAVKTGEAKMVFTTLSSQIKEELEAKLVIEEPLVKETFTTTGKINPSETKKNTAQEGLIMPKDISSNTGELKITLDDTKLNTLTAAIQYLYDYPYGCLEQRSSKIFPLIVFGDKVKNFISISNVKNIVEKELELWAKFQNSDGGFPFWLENGYSSSYIISVKVAKLLYYAKKNNYSIPREINLERLFGFIQKKEKYSDYETLYGMYVLTLHAKNVYFILDEYLKKKDKLDASELGFLTLAFSNLGKKDQAKEVFYRLKNFIKIGTQSIDLSDKESGYYFNSDINKLVLLLMSFNKLEPNSDTVAKIINAITLKQKKGYWKNTYTTEFVIEGYSHIFESEKSDETNYTAKVDINGQNIITKEFVRKKEGFLKNVINFFTGPDFKDNAYKADFSFNKAPLSNLKRDTLYPLNISMEGKGVLYYTISSTYALPQETVYPRDEGFSVFTEIKDMNDKVLPDQSELKLGSTYKMKVVLSSSKKRNYVVLRVPVPSGVDILDASFVTTAAYPDKNKEKNNEENYWRWNEPIQKIYDNEIVYIFDYFSNGKEEVEFLFRATTPGVFPTPPVSAECMYEEEVFGRTGGTLYYLLP